MKHAGSEALDRLESLLAVLPVCAYLFLEGCMRHGGAINLQEEVKTVHSFVPPRIFNRKEGIWPDWQRLPAARIQNRAITFDSDHPANSK